MPLPILNTQQVCFKHQIHLNLRFKSLLNSRHNWHALAVPSNRFNFKTAFSNHLISFYRNRRPLSTASSFRILATATNSPENALQDFLGWAIANGIEGLDGDKSKIGLFVGNNGERGIAATAPLRKNETFAKIPLRLAITDDPDDEESNALLGKDSLWSVRLACKLLRLKSQGANSPWFPYLNSLPTSVPAPLVNFSWEDVQSIAYEPARRQFDKTAWMVSSAWASLPPGAATAAVAVDEATQKSTPPSTTTKSELTSPSREEFDWAISIVHSRTFGTAGKGGGVGVRMLVPLVDMLNHSGDQDFTDNSGSGSGNTSSGAKSNLASQQPVATATDNVRWDLVSKIGGEFFMVLTSTRDIQQGEELLLSYGERNNDDFFLHYGFIPPRNIHDDVILFSTIEEAIDWHLEKYIPLGKLPPNQLQEAITAAYAAALKEEDWNFGGGGSGNGGSGTSDTSDSYEAALAAMPEAEADHIRKERSVIKLLSKGRTDARLVAAIESLHGTARIAGAADVAVNCQDHVREAVAARAVEVLRNMYITGMKLEDDLEVLANFSTGGGNGGGGGELEDEHGFRYFADYYISAISSSPWKDRIYSKPTSSPSSAIDSSSSSTTLIDASGVGEDASLLAALQAAAPAPAFSSSKKTVFVDIEPGVDASASTSTDNAVHPLVRQYRTYKAMILWDAVLC
jgi:SET domain